MHMCGIGGILRVHPAGAEVPPPEAAIPEAWLDILDESIKHRGPDGAGRFRDRVARPDGSVVDVALVHRRLSILDHAGGGQPMVSPRGRPGRDEGLVAVVFNGCIYNHRELRKELRAAGHEFVSGHSDTEVLVHGWREWGEEICDHLEGMYAFAVWDRDKGDLWLARDLAGEKPLWYWTESERVEGDRWRFESLVFSSVASGPTRLAGTRRGRVEASSPDWIGDWVRFGASSEPPSAAAPFCFCASPLSTRALYAARHPLVESVAVRLRPLPQRDGTQRLSVERVDTLLRESVGLRLEADVPLGCFLSGGIDSSLVARYANETLGRVRTFTVRMPDQQYDESGIAAKVAGIIGTEHQTLECSMSPAEDLVSLVETLGAPLGDSSLLPTYWVSKAARQVVKVALSGDGGDELFCGYERHVAARWLRRWAPVAARFPASIVPDRDPKGRLSKLRRLASAAQNGYAELLAVFPMQDLRRLMPSEDFCWYQLHAFDEDDPAGQDFWEYLRNDLLLKVDTASMAVGLEVRAPFLSVDLIDACLRAPYEDLMPRGQRKGLLRQVAREYLPADIVDRPKMGFAIPISEWFRTDYGGMKTLLMDRLRSTEPFGPPSLGIELDMPFIERMIGEHMERRRDHGQRLYMLLVLSIWAAWVGRQRAK